MRKVNTNKPGPKKQGDKTFIEIVEKENELYKKYSDIEEKIKLILEKIIDPNDPIGCFIYDSLIYRCRAFAEIGYLLLKDYKDLIKNIGYKDLHAAILSLIPEDKKQLYGGYKAFARYMAKFVKDPPKDFIEQFRNIIEAP